MTAGPYVLTLYPLTSDAQRELTTLLGEPIDFVDLSSVRRGGPRGLLRTVGRLRGRRCILAFQDEASLGGRAVVEAAAGLLLPRTVEVVLPGVEREPPVTRPLLNASGRLVGATVRTALDAVHARRDLARLAATPRSHARIGSMRRVLVANLSPWFGLKVGGALAHTAGVIGGLRRRGYEIDLFAASPPEVGSEGTRVVLLEPPPFGVVPELNFYAFARHAVETIDRMAAAPYDFVYQRLSFGAYGGVVLSRRLGTPLVVEYNGSEVWAARQWGRPPRWPRLAEQAEMVTLQHAHLVVTVSQALHDELTARGVPADRVVWHPNGVDPEQYGAEELDASKRTAVRAQYDIPDDAIVATFVGTFGHWHGIDLLARSIAELTRARPGWLARHDVRFLLVGDGVRMADVREVLADSVGGGRVTLTGLVPHPDAAAHLSASDILLSPHVPNRDGSPFFGSPTKLFEYMASGKAILASDLDQIGSVLQPSLHADRLPSVSPEAETPELAVLTRPADEASLLEALRFLVENPDWRNVLGRNAREAVIARYTWTHHVDAFLDRVQSVDHLTGA